MCENLAPITFIQGKAGSGKSYLIKELRKLKGLTQEQIAELINIEPPNISKIESGTHFPQPENIDPI